MSIDNHTRGLLRRARDNAEKAAKYLDETLKAGDLGSGFDFAGDLLADAISDLEQVRDESQ